MTNLEMIITISSGILVPIALFIANRQWGRKKYVLIKFNHNKTIIYGIIRDMRKLLLETNAWNSILLKDTNTTYREYLEVLEERYEIEYSDLEFRALKKKKLSIHQLTEYVEKLKIQEDSLNQMRINLDLIIKKVEINN